MSSPHSPIARRPGPSRPPPWPLPCQPAANTASLPSPPPTKAIHGPTPASGTHPIVTTPEAPPTPCPDASLPRTWPPLPAIPSGTTVKRHLSEFNTKYLGLSDFDATAATLGETFYLMLVSSRDNILHTVPWTSSLPSKVSLRLTAFGRQDTLHSFTQAHSRPSSSTSYARGTSVSPTHSPCWTHTPSCSTCPLAS